MITMGKNIFYKESNEILNDLKKERFETGTAIYAVDQMSSIKVTLIPNTQMAPALFRPIDKRNNVYEAHPTTIRAVRPDIFATDENLTLYQSPYSCQGCKQEIDLQFWKFCPYCERKIEL